MPWPNLTLSRVLLLALFTVLSETIGSAQAEQVIGPKRDISYRNELQHSINRGLSFLQSNQNSNGWWSTPDQPAITALALLALKSDPAGKFKNNNPGLEKAYAFLLGCVRADGSIHRTNQPTYNTSICMLALLAANEPKYDPIILKARQFLVSLQRDFGEKGRVDSPLDGGIGYGSRYEHSDMGNTVQALEALYYSKHLLADQKNSTAKDLDWGALLNFLQSCQNLPSHNQETWASDDPDNKGGFIYYPGQSMAGTVTNANGRVALRSYGSISYAGLLSYVYADVKKDDPRVQAVLDWLRKNYTLQENPGMGPQGLYYYFHTMTKALSAFGLDDLPLANGRSVPWRREVSMKLLDLQQKDGSWINESARWLEKDPALVTSYVVLSLSRIHNGL